MMRSRNQTDNRDQQKETCPCPIRKERTQQKYEHDEERSLELHRGRLVQAVSRHAQSKDELFPTPEQEGSHGLLQVRRKTHGQSGIHRRR